LEQHWIKEGCAQGKAVVAKEYSKAWVEHMLHAVRESQGQPSGLRERLRLHVSFCFQAAMAMYPPASELADRFTKLAFAYLVVW